jgi:hypothetical protein
VIIVSQPAAAALNQATKITQFQPLLPGNDNTALGAKLGSV